MTTVGVRALKANLSAYLRKVRAGEPLQVTDRGQAIAEIVPAGWASAQPIPPGLAEMVRTGKARLPLRPHGRFELTPLKRSLPDGTAQRLIDEGRGDR